MKEKIVNERNISRAEADRELRSYRVLGSILKSAAAYGRSVCVSNAAASSFQSGGFDSEGGEEAAIEAQMFAIRSLMLSLEDAEERFLLYHYYVKGLTLDKCARLLGVSKRTVYRLKNRALDSAAKKLAEKGGA